MNLHNLKKKKKIVVNKMQFNWNHLKILFFARMYICVCDIIGNYNLKLILELCMVK